MNIFDQIVWANKIGTILILAGVAIQFARTKSIRAERWAVVAIFGVEFGTLVAYYIAWWHRLASSPLTRTLLWPHSNYLVPHVTSDLTSLFVGWSSGLVLLAILTGIFIRRGQSRMLDRSDIGLLFLVTISVGWPSFFIAFAIVFLLAVLYMLVLVVLRKKTLQDRLIISPVIIPAGIITILFQEKLLAFTHLVKIGF